MATPARRSTRTRKANPKYADESWDRDTLRLLRDSDDTFSSSAPSVAGTNVEVDDQSVAEVTRDESMDEDFALDDSASLVSDSSVSGSEPETVTETFHRNSVAYGASVDSSEADSTTLHSRGLESLKVRGGTRRENLVYVFGPELEDLIYVLRARETWLGKYDITLPSRKSLEQWFAISEDLSMYQRRGTSRPSLDDGNAQVLYSKMRQSQKQVKFGDSDNHLKLVYAREIIHPAKACSVVLGPSANETLFDLKSGAAVDFGTAFCRTLSDEPNEESSGRLGSRIDLDPPIPANNNYSLQEPQVMDEKLDESRIHEGWLLNVGERPVAISWLPHGADTQYLAVAVRACAAQRQTVQQSLDQNSPAFSPSAEYPAAIQLWRFRTKPVIGRSSGTLDMNDAPTLIQLVCTNFGDVRSLAWWPRTPPTCGSERVGNGDGSDEWLAALYSDGKFYLHCVQPHDVNEAALPDFVLIHNPALTIEPPSNTIFTSFCFASERDLVLGTMDGTICIYDIITLLKADKGMIGEPVLHLEVHSTYVMSIVSAGASDQPHIIMSTSAAGEVAITDLRCPEQDCLQVHKARLPSRNLLYSPFSKSLLIAVNKSGNTEARTSYATNLVAHHLRHFYTSTIVAFLPQLSGSATATAGSNLHPCILIGNASGSVYATNYLRRVLPQGRSGSASYPDGYLQQLCSYMWQPRHDGAQDHEDPVGAPTIDLYYGRDVRSGLCRFREGFKPEKAHVTRDGPRSKTKKGELGTEVIFEEEQAVSVIEWNPNPRFAGLAAMAWASGLVKIQDISHDASW